MIEGEDLEAMKSIFISNSWCLITDGLEIYFGGLPLLYLSYMNNFFKRSSLCVACKGPSSSTSEFSSYAFIYPQQLPQPPNTAANSSWLLHLAMHICEISQTKPRPDGFQGGVILLSGSRFYM